MSYKKQLSFHVLVEQREGAYVATCLETSLIATSLDEDDVVSKMVKLVVRQVEFAVKHHRLAAILHPAGDDVFQKYFSMHATPVGSSQKPVAVDNMGGLIINQTAYAAAAC